MVLNYFCLFLGDASHYVEPLVNQTNFLLSQSTVHSEHLRRPKMWTETEVSILQEKQPYGLESFAHANYVCLQELLKPDLVYMIVTK